MQPQDQLSDSVDPAHKHDPSLHLTLSDVSLMDYEPQDGHESSHQDLALSFGNDAHSSEVSLGIPMSLEERKRKLLLVYIHGFMGSEASFQKFPAHVHNIVAKALAESHVVYSKVYPRYKSRRVMSIARDDFSKWSVNDPSKYVEKISNHRATGLRRMSQTKPTSFY